jgi:general secretion pathway protein J
VTSRARGLVLLEVLVAIGILALVSTLVYGAFDGMTRGKKNVGRLNDRYHEGRGALARLARDLSSAFLSGHTTLTQQMSTRVTVFSVSGGSPADRLDFAAFAHTRLVKDAHEGDQCEVGYFGSPDPQVSGKTDLARREQPVLDLEPKKGGEVNVLAEDIDLFDVRMLDPLTGLWQETWDTSQAIGQPNRLPLQVQITLVLKGGAGGQPIKLQTKVPIAMNAPLTFAVPR